MSAKHCRSLALLVFFTLSVTGAPLTTAQDDATPIPTVVLPPESVIEGLSLAEWNARSLQWFFSAPPAINSILDQTGAYCGYGQHGPVWFLAGAERDVVRECTVPEGVHLFVPIFGSACSTVEPPPFFGRDEDELSKCASDALDMAEGASGADALGLSIDGAPAADILSYRAASSLFTVWLPEDNMLGVPAGVAQSVADGYQAMIAPLPAGEHEVVVTSPGPAGTVTIT